MRDFDCCENNKKILIQIYEQTRINITEEQLEVTVRDEGEGFDWRNQKESEGLEKTSGKGTTFIKTFFDSYQYNDKGNEITLIRKKPPTNNKKTAQENSRFCQRWLNAWMLRRRTKPFTDCEEPFKHLNGKCSLGIALKKDIKFPGILGIKIK